MLKYLNIALFLFTELFSLTLNSALYEVIHTNPDIQEKLKYYNSVKEDLKGSKSGYRPKIDLHLGAGIERAYNSSTTPPLSTDPIWKESDFIENRLVLTQNLYEGYGTQNEIKRQESRLKSAYYSYYETVNDVMFGTIESYLNVLKNVRLLEESFNNVIKHKKTFMEIKLKNEAGTGIKSELDRVAGRLVTAQSDYIIQKYAYKDSIYSFHKILGRYIDGNGMITPKFETDTLPADLENGLTLMLLKHPSLKVAEFNILNEKYMYETSKKNMRPKVDFELSKEWNENLSGIDGEDNNYRAMVTLDYNIYNGHADNTYRQSLLSNMFKQNEIKRSLQRDATNGLQLSWSGYRLLAKQQKYLKQNAIFMKKVLKSYKNEFNLGRRTLIDLLDAEDEAYKAKAKIITSQYDFLISKYRILYSVGNLFDSFNFDEEKRLKKVEYKKRKAGYYDDDILPVDSDIDLDKVVDNLDICQNSEQDFEISKSGCEKLATLEYLYEPLSEPIEIMKKNYIKNKNELQINELKLNESAVFNYVTFKNNSLELTKKSKDIMRVLIKQLKEFKSDVVAEITIFSNDTNSESENFILSSKRAYNIKKILLMNGIESEKIAVFAEKKFDKKIANLQTNYIAIKVADSYDYARDDVSVIENDKIIFKTKSTEISADVIDELHVLAKKFKALGDVKIEVVSHCNEFSSKSDNIQLSEQRSSLIKAIFIRSGLNGESIIDIGMGRHERQFDDDSFDLGLDLETAHNPKNSVEFIIKN